MNNDYWKIRFLDDDTGEIEELFINADYSTYTGEKIIKILTEVHPDWKDIQPWKVAAVPFPVKKK